MLVQDKCKIHGLPWTLEQIVRVTINEVGEKGLCIALHIFCFQHREVLVSYSLASKRLLNLPFSCSVVTHGFAIRRPEQ